MVERLKVRKNEEDIIPIHESGNTSGSRKKKPGAESGQGGSGVPIRPELSKSLDFSLTHEKEELDEEEKRLNRKGYKRPFKTSEDVTTDEYEEFFNTKETPEEVENKLNEDATTQIMTPEEHYYKLVEDDNKEYDLEKDKELNPIQIISKDQTAHALSGENLTGKKKPWWKKYLSGTKEKKLVIEPNLLEIPQNKINSQLGADLKEQHNLEVGFVGTAGDKADKFFEASSQESVNFKNVEDEDYDHKYVKPGAEKKSQHKIKREINYRKGRQYSKAMSEELKKGYQNAVEEDLINAEIAEIDKELREHKN